MLQNTTSMHCWKFGPQSSCTNNSPLQEYHPPDLQLLQWRHKIFLYEMWSACKWHIWWSCGGCQRCTAGWWLQCTHYRNSVHTSALPTVQETKKHKHNKISVWGQCQRKTVYQSMINYIFIEKLCYFHDIHKIKEEFYNCCTPAAKTPEF